MILFLRPIFLFFLLLSLSICMLLTLSLPLRFNSARANEYVMKPRWELGLGMLSFRLPHYRGSDQTRTYYWPLPYFVFRGESFTAENSGLSGQVIQTENFTLGLSLSGTLRVNAGKNKAREGMPSLDPSFEIGPLASWDFWKSANKKNIFSINVPFRGVFSAEFFRISPIGTFSVPFLAWTALPQPMTLGLFSEMTVAAMYGSQHYHDYYYGVAPQYANSTRAAYEAHRGYSGAHATWYLSKKWHKLFSFVFVRYDYLKGAAFEDSPLVKRKDYLAFGGGIVWYAFQSEDLVKRKSRSILRIKE